MVSENYSLCSSTLSSQNNRKYSKKMCKNKCVCYNRIIWFNMKKWRWKWKIDHIYTTNRPKPRHGHKYTNYKMGHSTMMVICINQHLSNIWSSVHEKVKQHWEAKLKKSVAFFVLWDGGQYSFWSNNNYFKKSIWKNFSPRPAFAFFAFVFLYYKNQKQEKDFQQVDVLLFFLCLKNRRPLTSKICRFQ